MTILANFSIGLLGLNAGLLFMEVLLLATSVFLMLLILVQRGKGGGLTGALGGMGGQSAFGSKAGDAFTKITVITAIIWITLCMLTIAAFNPPPRSATVVPDQIGAGDDTLTEEATIESEDLGDGTSEITEEVEDKGFQLDLDGPADSTDDASNPSDAGAGADSSSSPDDGSSESQSDSSGN